MNSSSTKADIRQVQAHIRDAITAAEKILVVSHVGPDGDSLGTQLAVARYLRLLSKEVFLVRDSEVPSKYRFLPGISEIPHIDNLPADFKVDTAVILECPTITRAGSVHKQIDDEVNTINIDHHIDNSFYGNINWIDSDSSSVGEMIYEYFQWVGYRIDSQTAELLYTAILTDTGRFRYESTSPRTMTIAGELIAAGANPRRICDEVYFGIPLSTMKLTGKVLSGIEFLHEGKIAVLQMTTVMLKESGADQSESDGLVDFTMRSAGVLAGVLLKEVDNQITKVSLRSSNGINVSQLAAKYGGGGHAKAAGCTLKMPLASAREEIIIQLKKACDELG
jgi:phosphoesterase RecJ-like protein